MSDEENLPRPNQLRVLEAVGEGRDTVRALWQMFMHDISDISGYDVAGNGRYDDTRLLDGPDDFPGGGLSCLPFLIAVGDNFAGFAIVKARKKVNREVLTRWPDYYISDFFVMRKYRRRGTGQAAVNQLWDYLPGKWGVAQLFNHGAATAFWRAVIGERTGGDFVEEPAADAVLQSGHRYQEFFVQSPQNSA